ncbi:MAG: linear amide C-N hydrolase [Spirochaetales bacterium]|nr:linear amide C-N hydrolase [Spirochaetales bacterium]
MKKVILLFIWFLVINEVFPCSAFMIQNNGAMCIGKTLDWMCEDAFLTINRRGIRKSSYISSKSNNPFFWVSKYGSVTFNPNGVGFCSGGMNEVGLVVEESSLSGTEYPSPDERPEIGEIQWIQFILDNCATVEEVIETEAIIRIRSFVGASHYFVGDRNGNALTIDCVDGKMVYNIIPSNGVQVLTNNRYNWSRKNLKNYQGFGGCLKIYDNSSSKSRFRVAASMIKNYNPEEANISDYSFSILDKISQDVTVWRIVYDIENLMIHIKTKSRPNRRTINFSNLKFDADQPILFTRLNQDEDEINSFREYSVEENFELFSNVVKAWKQAGWNLHFRDQDIKDMAEFPLTFVKP